MQMVVKRVTNTLHIRQQPRIITQTLTRESTTFTTHVTLGLLPETAPTHAPGPGSSRNHSSGSSSHGLTKAQIGAIIGSSVGFVLLILILWCYCTRRVPKKHDPGHTVYEYYEYNSGHGSSYMTEVSPSPPPPPAPPRTPAPVVKPRPGRLDKSVRPAKPVGPPPPEERLPGCPRFPTYTALPIPNPRKGPKIRHLY